MTQQDLYSKLWRIADHILKENNPCQILKDSEGKVSCIRFREGPKRTLYDHRNGLCCVGCKHLGPNGCTVEALACKLGGCAIIGELPMYAPNASVVNTSLKMLHRAATAGGMRLAGLRESKTEYFKRAR